MSGQSWNRLPAIKPNYGKPKSLLPKTDVARVLLHDNVNSDHLLQIQLSRISLEKRRRARILELHRKSFVARQSIKQQELRSMGIHGASLIPEHIASAHYKAASFTRLSEADMSVHRRILEKLTQPVQQQIQNNTNTENNITQFPSLLVKTATQERNRRKTHVRKRWHKNELPDIDLSDSQ